MRARANGSVWGKTESISVSRKDQPSDPESVSGDKIGQMAMKLQGTGGKQLSLPNAQTLT